MSRQHTVYVWEKPQVISVYQKSKTVWIASGKYMGELKQVKDRSESSAIKRWREWARYKGN
jgi:hypothetical protein